MKENIKNKQSGTKALLKISICLALLFGVFLVLPQYSSKSFATEQDTSAEYCYLSDMNWESESKAYSLLKDITSSGSKISVKVEGAYYTFDKGIWAHAASTVIYDLSTTPNGEKYDYFTAYLGLNQTAASTSNGVIFKIYTSTDKKNWTIKYNEASKVCKPGENATFVTIDISEAKYLKLEAGHNGSNGNDHSVYADAKLIKKTYKEPGEDLVPSITELDKKIKEDFVGADLSTNPEYELTLLKREFISRVGNYALRRFLSGSKENEEVYKWLTSDVDNLRLYIMGGTPPGGYYNSLTQLSRLYNEYSDDFTNNTPIVNAWCKEGMTRGDLYKKMAITISLTHSQTVALWMHNAAANRSDALRRYAIYKYMYENGKLSTNLKGNWDITKWFESLNVEEMRFVMNNSIDDEEILWLNAYVQDRLDRYKGTNYLTPHPYMAYVWPNYTNKLYYENDDYFNAHFAVNKRDDNTGRELVNENGENTGKVGLWDTEFVIPGGKTTPTYTIKISKGTKDKVLSKVWMNFRNKFGTGAVCGGISKTGSNIRATHGIPATVIGQPGHAALLFYTKTTDGKGYWGIDNDVSGWTKSEKGERMLLGWGNASYSKGYSVVYMVLAQEALNDYANLVKCEELVMLAKVYNDDLAKKEEIYRDALKAQSINIDAWYGLITTFNANENKTENDYYALAEELAENLKFFPLPMYHLTNLIKPKLKSAENIYKFTILQTRILTEGSKTTTNKVLQPGVTRTEANYLLGSLDKTIATFSFDGANAGKIVLSNKFAGNGVRWDYSLDGKQTWNEVSFTADEEHKLQLTPEQISSITAENDIYVHIVGVNYDESNLFKIDITEQALLSTLYANDLENRVVGINLVTEWRYTENDTWTSYSVASPDLTGDKTVQVRQGATGTKLASPTSEVYTFTQDDDNEGRRYITGSHLSINSYSTQSVDSKRPFYAPNAIDANMKTLWHTDFRYDIRQQEIKPFITIELDKARYISALEFAQIKYPGKPNDPDFVKNVVIYVSEDGENWTEAGKIENCTDYNALREVTFAKSVYGKYVKLEMGNGKEDDMFSSIAMINLFEDITKVDNTNPTASVYYSPEEPTNQYVIARLVNPSKEITITNNDGKDTYIFTENGSFTFEFEDAEGNKGSAYAEVNWIKKDAPTADVEYKFSNDRKLSILLGNISEDVYLLDKDNNKINYIEVEKQGEKTRVKSIAFLDSLGNIYKVAELDENGIIKKITYKNTTGEVSNVAEYVTIIKEGEVAEEYYYDSEGNSVTVTDEEKQTLRTLQQAISNPLECYLEQGGEYEFKLLDKASNIAYKSIKADYINDDTKILASDISYDITRQTNRNVTATISTYGIDINGKDLTVEVISEGGKTHTFTENGEFTFEYKESSDTDINIFQMLTIGNKESLDTNDWEVKQHIAKVSWIDKVVPTATLEYSTTNKTDEPVTVTLVDESEEIIITNNGGNRTYTFTENGTFTFEFEDVAGNKGSVTAKVNWIVNQENPEYIFKSDKYNIEEEYISRIVPGITVVKFKENVETNQELVFTDKDGNILAEDGLITTGSKLKVGDKEHTLIVIGDITGNGKIGLTDLAKLKLHYIDLEPLTGIQLRAGDINGDGEIGVTDIAQIKLVLVGLTTIE